ILHRVCSRMVDLPMPGSPPISTTDPSTRPPPSTRSSSPEAVEKRGTSSTLTSARVLICTCSPAQPARPLGVAALASSRVSTRVFQAPHSPHCPAHFGKVAPHSVQPYMRLALAMEWISLVSDEGGSYEKAGYIYSNQSAWKCALATRRTTRPARDR